MTDADPLERVCQLERELHAAREEIRAAEDRYRHPTAAEAQRRDLAVRLEKSELEVAELKREQTARQNAASASASVEEAGADREELLLERLRASQRMCRQLEQRVGELEQRCDRQEVQIQVQREMTMDVTQQQVQVEGQREQEWLSELQSLETVVESLQADLQHEVQGRQQLSKDCEEEVARLQASEGAVCKALRSELDAYCVDAATQPTREDLSLELSEAVTLRAQEVSSLRSELRELEQMRTDMEQNGPALHAQEAETSIELRARDAEIASLRSSITQLRTHLMEARKQVGQMRAQAEMEIQGLVSRHQAEVSGYQEDLAAMTQQCEELRAEASKHSELVQQQARDCISLKQQELKSVRLAEADRTRDLEQLLVEAGSKVKEQTIQLEALQSALDQSIAREAALRADLHIVQREAEHCREAARTPRSTAQTPVPSRDARSNQLSSQLAAKADQIVAKDAKIQRLLHALDQLRGVHPDETWIEEVIMTEAGVDLPASRAGLPGTPGRRQWA
mmetsp:Transcript_6898/g.16446  ORF Transcript_6898/g.16446 Transcript_6898/m.16446 type:complete len:512 (-) Transcript_6898:37-1572(-)